MLSNDIVTDGQPQASTISLRSKEWIENEGQRLLSDKWTRIMEIHTHALTLRAGAQVYRDLPTLICFHRFHGIQAQVNENLF